MIFFGPADYSQSIGVPGQFDDPRIQETRIKMAETARKYEKFAGTVGSLGNFNKLKEMGFRFISVGADVVGFKTIAKI